MLMNFQVDGKAPLITDKAQAMLAAVIWRYLAYCLGQSLSKSGITTGWNYARGAYRWLLMALSSISRGRLHPYHVNEDA